MRHAAGNRFPFDATLNKGFLDTNTINAIESRRSSTITSCAIGAYGLVDQSGPVLSN